MISLWKTKKRAIEKEEEAHAAEPPNPDQPSKEELLLTELRDLLAQKIQ